MPSRRWKGKQTISKEHSPGLPEGFTTSEGQRCGVQRGTPRRVSSGSEPGGTNRKSPDRRSLAGRAPARVRGRA